MSVGQVICIAAIIAIILEDSNAGKYTLHIYNSVHRKIILKSRAVDTIPKKYTYLLMRFYTDEASTYFFGKLFNEQFRRVKRPYYFIYSSRRVRALKRITAKSSRRAVRPCFG